MILIIHFQLACAQLIDLLTDGIDVMVTLLTFSALCFELMLTLPNFHPAEAFIMIFETGFEDILT